MREVQIQIEPFAYIALQKLTISQSINQHGEARGIMRIKDEWKDAYLETLRTPTWVRIMGKGEGEGATYAVLFHGLVTHFALGQNGYETILELQLSSGTILMDRQKHFRVFQNEEADCMKLYQDLTPGLSGRTGKSRRGKGRKNRGSIDPVSGNGLAVFKTAGKSDRKVSCTHEPAEGLWLYSGVTHRKRAGNGNSPD